MTDSHCAAQRTVVGSHGKRAAKETLRAAKGAALIYLDPPFGTGKSFYLSDPDTAGVDGELAYDDPQWEPYTLPSCAAQIAELSASALANDGVVVVHCDARASWAVESVFAAALGHDSYHGHIVVRAGSRDSAPRPSKSLTLTSTHNLLHIFGRSALPQIPGSIPSFVVDGTRHLDTLWTDLEIRGRMTRYPTEKSEGLAERLISWLTRPGDIVVDPFAGSGTVPAVAVRMGRRIVSGDRSSVAAKISSSRIAAAAESMGCVVSMTNTIAPDSPNER